ncbi:MAG: insulinase family protein [Bacteroidota bacterium]
MKNSMKTWMLSCTFALVAAAPGMAQFKTESQKSAAGYKFEQVTNDPLKARIYTLQNGLKIYLTVNKNEPRIQTLIAVRAGSKNDPADATGLAHYLEHLLFKGTDTYGTSDYAKEKPYLDEIEQLYNTYRTKTNEAERKAIYRKIDSVSGVAAKYAIANEYDKMITSIGARSTNAHTSNEETVYENDIPSNQLQKWLKIEGERFRNPVLRLFHTELEAVYEEKNISLDNDGREQFAALLAGVFKNHPYGTQTTIGTIQHLKNPSITKIKDFYNTYYVPNNMAICLSGDLDPDKTVRMIDEAFGQLPAKPLPAFTFTPEVSYRLPAPAQGKPQRTPPAGGTAESTISMSGKPTVTTLYGPDAESIIMGYRFPGAASHDATVLKMIDMILSNANAGLIDLNLNQQQKVLNAGCSPMMLKDYSVHLFTGKPREGQSLEEVRDLLLGQIELVKQGKFDANLLKAIYNDFEISQLRRYESNENRATAMVEAFIEGREWSDYADDIEEVKKVTREEIIRVANEYYGNEYTIVFKRTGTQQNVEKVVKPEITPISVNREAISPFVQNVLSMNVEPIQPKFIDYKADIKETSLKSGVPVFALKNEENDLFSLYYVLDMGAANDKRLPLAAKYLQYLGTKNMSAEDFQKKMYELGSSFDVSAGHDQVMISLSGLQKNFKESVKLFEELLNNPKGDAEALQQLIAGELKGRKDRKLNKQVILNTALMSYAKNGPNNPFTNILPEVALKGLSPNELTQIISSLPTYQHRILYYGPSAANELVATLSPLHSTPKTLKAVPAAMPLEFQNTSENKVLFVDYPMVQAEVIWLTKSVPYNASMAPTVRMFNEYFGGGMSSVVFQTIRESKALAYSTYAGYTTPQKPNEPFYMFSYVGTQADKFKDAVGGMEELLNEMPKADALYANAKNSVKNTIATERITRADILFNYERAKKFGRDYDIRKNVYEEAPNLDYSKLEQFHAQYVKGQPHTLLVLGSKDKISMDELSKLGKVQVLTLEDIFGY